MVPSKLIDVTPYVPNGTIPYNVSAADFWFLHRKNSNEDNTWVFFSTILFSLTSLVGNLLTLAAFLSWKKLKTGQNVLLSNISVSDLLFTVFVFTTSIATYVRTMDEGGDIDKNVNPVSVLAENVKNNQFKSNDNADKNSGTKSIETACQVINYVLSVALYVAMYSPVANCVFKFFGEILRDGLKCRRNGKRNNNARYNLAQRHSYQQKDVTFTENINDNINNIDNVLTPCNAVISCVVIWMAFLLSNINLLQNSSSVSGDNLIPSTSIIGLHQPSICSNIPAMSYKREQQQQQQKTSNDIDLPSMVYQEHLSQQQIFLHEQQQRYRSAKLQSQRDDILIVNTAEKLRTLWLIFLVCAFLIPLAVISVLSGILLFRLQCRPSSASRNPLADVIPRDTVTSYSNPGEMALDGYLATYTPRKNSVILILAISVTRSVCWLPVQICLLLDVFGPDMQNNRWSHFHTKIEHFGTSLALIACTLNPIIYYFSLEDYRRSLVRIFRRLCRNDKRPKHLALERLSQIRNQRNFADLPYTHPNNNNNNNSIMNNSSSNNSSNVSGVYERCGIGSSTTRRPNVNEDGYTPKYNSLLKSNESDANETILSIISDSSNRINYA